MPIIQFSYPLQFTGRDLVPLTPEALATQMRVSRGFVRLCFDAGCPNASGVVSAADLLRWLFVHYEDVRAIAGLHALASVESLEPVTVERLRTSNAITTLLEYTWRRATDWRKKRKLREALEQVDRLANRIV